MLTCKNLTIGYGSNIVLENINFNVEEGDYLCILGGNGAGKSTLMKTILGLTPAISGEKKLRDKHKIGYLPQQTARQKDFPATVHEIVLSGCLANCGMRPFYNKEEKQRAIDKMELLGISNLSKRCYRELSGGQQERVLLARALCTSGNMLLMDEPTSGLDPEITAELHKLLGDLNKNEKITMVVISHDIASTLTYATKILYLGKNRFYGTKDEYITWKQQQEDNN